MPPLNNFHKSVIAVAISHSLSASLEAATIEVAGTCGLVDAIKTANIDLPTGGCTATYVTGVLGDDAIKLTSNLTVTQGVAPNNSAFLAIESNITIQGNDFSILRDDAGSAERFFDVTGSGTNLIINDLFLYGGSSTESGGSIYIQPNATVTINNSSICNNTAANSGGAIVVQGGDLILNDSSVSANRVTSTAGPLGTGGAVYANGGNVTINRGLFESNRGKRGAAIYSDGTRISIDGVTFNDNITTASGGALELYSPPDTITINNSIFTRNTAAQSGGAIRVAGSVTVTGGEFNNNSSTMGSGGAIYQQSSTMIVDSVAFNTNVADRGNGGAISSKQSDLTLRNSSITNNRSGSGGGVWADNQTSDEKNLLIIDGEIRGNGAFGAGIGAGISARGVNLQIQGAGIYGNRGRNGGGIDFASAGDRNLSLDSVTVMSNQATFNGGGLRVDNAASVTIVDSTISNNIAGNNYNGDGGGLHIDDAVVTISGSKFESNRSNEFGGGVYLKANSTASIENSTFNANSSTLGGGGLFSSSADNNVTFTGATIASNISAASGGGVFAQDGQLTIDRSTISGNTAAEHAGVVQSSGTFAMRVSTVSGNVSAAEFAVSILGSAIGKIYSSTIFANIGGGLTSPNDTPIQNTVIANNSIVDCAPQFGTLNALNNWFGDASCSGMAQGDPMLAALMDNNAGLNSQTLTHLPLSDSGLLGAGAREFCSGDFALDQRGVRRKVQCDIGAVEIPEEPQFFVIPLKNGRTLIFNL